MASFNATSQNLNGKWAGKLWSENNKTNTDTCYLTLIIDVIEDSNISGELSCYLQEEIYTVMSVIGKFDKQKRLIVLSEKKLLKNKLPNNWVVYFLEYNLDIAAENSNLMTGFAKCMVSSDPKLECTKETFKLSLQKK